MLSVPKVTARQRILVHLLDFRWFENSLDAPQEVCQSGIAKSIGIEERHLPQYLKALGKECLVMEKVAHVTGALKRRKIYFLSGEGLAEAHRIRDVLWNQKVLLRHPEGRVEVSKLKDICPALGIHVPTLRLLGAISGGMLDASDIAVGRTGESKPLTRARRRCHDSLILISMDGQEGDARLVDEIGRRMSHDASLVELVDVDVKKKVGILLQTVALHPAVGAASRGYPRIFYLQRRIA